MDNNRIVGTVTVSEYVTAQLIDDIVSTAFEGGINYWCKEIDHTPWDILNEKYSEDPVKYGSELISRGEIVKLYDAEENGWYNLTLEKLIKGLELYCKKSGSSISKLNDDFDANDADNIIQYSIFGELVYG